MQQTIITQSSKETFNLGKNLGQRFKGGEIIALIGELGAGKTVFTKGLAQGLGVKVNVISPTFTILKLYKIKSNVKKINYLCHIDAYRASSSDIKAIGAFDYIGRPDTITVIEWADRIHAILPKNIVSVKITHLEEDKRKVLIK